MRHVCWFVLVGIASVTAPLSGQVVESPYRFIETRHSAGPFVGYIATDPGEFDLGPRSSIFFGGRYDIRLTGPLSGEVGFGFAPSERTIYQIDPADGESLLALQETSMLIGLVEAGLRFHLTGQRAWNGLAPYVVATGGAVTDLTSSDVLEEEIPAEQYFRFGPSFALGVGAGTDLFIGDRFSFRFEVRDYVWRLTYPDGLTGSGAEETEWTHNFAPTIGGSYHF